MSVVVDGGHDRGVDIIYIDDDNRVINICSCKCVANFKKTKNNFPGDEIDKLISFIDDLLHHRDELLLAANAALATKIREIWELVGSGEGYRITVRLFSNQLTLAHAERVRLTAALERHQINLIEHGLYELAHGVVRSVQPKFRKKLLPLGNSIAKHVEGGHEGFLFSVALTDFFHFLHMGDKAVFDERLIADNVRYFLSLENPVNKEIRNSLFNSKYEQFWFMNNGAVIICDQLIGNVNGCFPITLVNPKIVNGGQTAKVIHAVGNEPLNTLQGSIIIKLIVSTDRNFIEQIAISSNTQSRIFGRDLRAFEPIQEKIAATLNNLGYFYRRKRGEESKDDSLKVIDAARAGQLLLSYARGLPTKAKTDSQDVFDELFNEAFDPNLTTAELIIAAHHCHEIIERRRQIAITIQKGINRSSYDESWLIEGHFHVLFVVGELMRRRGNELTDGPTAIRLIDEAITLVNRFVLSHPTSSSYRLFRSANSVIDLNRIIETEDKGGMKTATQIQFEF
ncbi:AIPR family protein [Rhodoblastus sp. 17X3]|uniref:AIPR family protein n=1 Tax=Rhodoblastus sp. 17X3 TaxID=3047026 RepID=UPI0024B7E1C8|nr:AIPR family protein [Rhodoblastus sp. 17X3]MDI9849431.1 AIPR family protein [Rhodoblastus sp. 17X3]